MEIRELHGLDEYRAIEALQKDVWSCSDLEVVPAVHLIPAVHVGAILLGAFDDGALVGFVYGFPGFEHGRPIIHSDMLGVRATHRDRGVGRALKFAQRERALAQGIDTITWTFDPLQARNAHVNFALLGVYADRYLRDYYGATTSPLHRTGTDRLWVTWPLRGRRTAGAESLRIEIPHDTDSLSDDDALQWRAKTREAFEDAFAAGYVVTAFEQSSYVLTRAPASRP